MLNTLLNGPYSEAYPDRIPFADLKEFILAARRGDQEAKLKIIGAYAKLIRKLLKNSTIQDSLGEDAASIIMLHTLDLIETCPTNNWKDLPCWFGFVLTKRCFGKACDERETNATETTTVDSVEEMEPIIVEPTDHIAESEDKMHVCEILSYTTPMQSTVLYENIINDRPLKEIGQHLDISESAVKSHKYRGLKTLSGLEDILLAK